MHLCWRQGGGQIEVWGEAECLGGGDRYALLGAATPTQSLRLQREASRKLIRSTQVLRSEQDLMWPQTLDEHVELFIQHFPCMCMQICFFLSQARSPDAKSKEFIAQLRSFLIWMASETG